MSISTHVLDAATGRPAVGVGVSLTSPDGSVVHAVTDADGRVADLVTGAQPGGTYRLRFDTGAYFAATGQEGFYPEVVVAVTIPDDVVGAARAHTHVPLLLAPYAYSTYRGS